jgi:hypothetical protein
MGEPIWPGRGSKIISPKKTDLDGLTAETPGFADGPRDRGAIVRVGGISAVVCLDCRGKLNVAAPATDLLPTWIG